MATERYLLVKITDPAAVGASAAYWARVISADVAKHKATAFVVDVSGAVQLAANGSDNCAAEALRNGLALL